MSKQGWPKLGLQSRKEIEAVVEVVAEHIFEARRKHLYKGLFSPALSILSQLAFGQTQNRN